MGEGFVEVDKTISSSSSVERCRRCGPLSAIELRELVKALFMLLVRHGTYVVG